MKKLLAILTIFMLLLSFGCAASRSVPIPDFSEMPSFKGKTSKTMNKRFGQPDRKYSTANNGQIFEYRWPAESKKAMNAMMAFGSFGISSGNDSTYVDMMRCLLFNEIVAKCDRIDEVINVSLPGIGSMGLQSQPEMVADTINESRISESKPKMVEVAQPIVAKKETAKEPTAQSSVDPPETMTSSKTFPNKTIKTVLGKIITSAETNGMEVVEKKKSTLSLVTSGGAKINVNLKQVKKDTVVELTTTGNPNMSQDFQKIYSVCK